MIGLLAAHAEADDSATRLVMATWGLVVATSLLFLASLVPAVGQFVSWSNRKKALASDLIPTLHGIRKRATDMRSSLLPLVSPVSQDDIVGVANDSDHMKNALKKIENHEGLTLDQRLEINVLGVQVATLRFHLTWLYSPGDPDEEEGFGHQR